MKRRLLLFLLIIISSVMVIGCEKKKKEEPKPEPKPKINDVEPGEFDYSFLRLETNENNMVYSPLSIKYALNMLREGATGETKEELDKVLKDLELTKYESYKKNLSIANGIFIKEDFKNKIKDSYVDTLNKKYDAEVIYDKFSSAKNINAWIKKKTLDIIDNVVSDEGVQSSKVLLANALAIDMEWLRKFDETGTHGDTFYKSNKDKKEAAFMSENTKDKSYNYYQDSELAILSMPLKKYGDTELEFVAIMPKNLNDYILNGNVANDLKKIHEIGKNEELIIRIPKFKFNYELNLVGDLQKLNINKVFTEDAELSLISDAPLYVGDAIHKADIEFSEDGVKAAAVTVIYLNEATAIEQETKFIRLTFDKPFMFIIRDKNTKENWFVGSVYEPILWNDIKDEYEPK